MAGGRPRLPPPQGSRAFIGKTAALFGLAWFPDGEEHNLKSQAAAKELTQKVSLVLGERYEKLMAEPKVSHTIAGKEIIARPRVACAPASWR